jgi:hypothetical protein
MARSPKTLAMAAFVALASVVPLHAEPQKKPPVPPGRDPGGFAIAVIGSGLDYTRPEIAQRLARDGEGEIVGFDLEDSDRRPYAKPEGAKGSCGDIGCNALPAHLALAEGQAARLAPFAAVITEARMLAGAIGMVAKSPARVVLIDGVPSAAVMAAAAERFPQLVFIAPAPDPAPQLPRAALANVILVRDAASAEPKSAAAAPPVAADLATPAAGRALNALARCPDTGCPMETGLADRLAAARIAALAVRLVAVEPGHDGAGLKARIAALAVASPGSARAGFIAEPHRPFWLE